MSDLLLAAHYGYGGWTDWLGHTVISALVHGLIYSLIFRVMHQLTLAQGAVLVGIVLIVLFLWSRSRDRRGW